MDQRIFEQGLSVEATSLYLLMTALSDQGTPLHREHLLTMWNSEKSALDRALIELAGRGIAEPQPGGQWALLPFDQWRQP